MSELRFNFLNWRPDLEDTEHDGLTVADNVIHEPEGYKPVHLGSAGSFATTGGLAATTATILSCVAKPIGSGEDVLCAWVRDATYPELHVGINGVTLTTTATGYPQKFSTAGSVATGRITAFDVCEYAGKVFFVAQMQQDTTSATEERFMAGYLDYE